LEEGRGKREEGSWKRGVGSWKIFVRKLLKLYNI